MKIEEEGEEGEEENENQSLLFQRKKKRYVGGNKWCPLYRRLTGPFDKEAARINGGHELQYPAMSFTASSTQNYI